MQSLREEGMDGAGSSFLRYLQKKRYGEICRKANNVKEG